MLMMVYHNIQYLHISVHIAYSFSIAHSKLRSVYIRYTIYACKVLTTALALSLTHTQYAAEQQCVILARARYSTTTVGHIVL